MDVAAEPTRDVFILGAGFSRALSPYLPLTDELGNACLNRDRLGEDPRVPTEGFASGAFETWLSAMAEPQPYLSEQVNLENQALFLRFSDAIAEVLGERVNDALNDPAPGWLTRFITAAHCRRATLITFNYDTLVECAVASRQIFRPGYPEPVFWAEVLGNVPGWAPGASRLAATQVETLRLLKLHGSLNWYWVPGDTSGISMARRVLPGSFGAPRPYTDDDRRRELPGRVPFVVPPSATKSSYYRNPIVREVWTQAADSLRSASHVHLFGYSLPPSDTTFSGMLWQTLQHNAAPVRVADVRADVVLERLRALGFDPARLHHHDAESNPIATAAAMYCREISVLALRAARSEALESRSDPLCVAWAADSYATITGVEVDDQEVILCAEEPTPLGRATRIRRDERLPTLEDVLVRSVDGCAWLLRDHCGDIHEVVDWTHFAVDVGYGRGHWNMLTASGAGPVPTGQ